MELELVDKDNQIFTLDKCFRTSVDGFELTKDAQKFFRSDGGFFTGDDTAEVSRIRLEYWKAGKTDLEFINALRPIMKFLLAKKDPYYLRANFDSGALIVRWRIATKSHQVNMPGELFLRSGDFAFEMFALDHFPEEDAATTVNQNGITDGQILNVSNDGDLIGYPIFTIEALSPLPQFVILNLTNGLFFQIDDVSFVPPRIFTLDFVDGLVDLQGVERAKSISAGGPITLETGNNQIQFNGAQPVNLTVTHRNRLAIF